MPFVGGSALASGATTVLPVYATATAGNLLIACVSGNQAASFNFTVTGATTGWVQRSARFQGSVRTEIWEKIAVGADTMPTWNGASAVMACVVGEFSLTTVFDQQGTAGGTTGPTTVTATGVDITTADLVIAILSDRTAATAFTQTNTDNVNSLGVGVGINVLGDNGSTSQVGHHRSVYVLTPSTGAVADSDAMTWTPTAATTQAALCIASYSAAPVGLSGVLREDYNRAGTVWGVVPKDVWRETQQGLSVAATEDSWAHRVRDKDLGVP